MKRHLCLALCSDADGQACKPPLAYKCRTSTPPPFRAHQHTSSYTPEFSKRSTLKYSRRLIKMSDTVNSLNLWTVRKLSRVVNGLISETAPGKIPESSRGRDVYIIHWGVKPSGGTSFHYCLLVADPEPQNRHEPSADTTGVVFSWGSFGGRGHSWDNLVKSGGKSRQWPFDWDKEVAGRNTYKFIGCTTRSDSYIAGRSKSSFLAHAGTSNNTDQLLTLRTLSGCIWKLLQHSLQ